MTVKEVVRHLDLMRIALGLETRAEREAKAERVVKDSGVQMRRYGDGVIIRFKNGRQAFVESELFR